MTEVSTVNAILLGSKDHLTTGRKMEENHPYKKIAYIFVEGPLPWYGRLLERPRAESDHRRKKLRRQWVAKDNVVCELL